MHAAADRARLQAFYAAAGAGSGDGAAGQGRARHRMRRLLCSVRCRSVSCSARLHRQRLRTLRAQDQCRILRQSLSVMLSMPPYGSMREAPSSVWHRLRHGDAAHNANWRSVRLAVQDAVLRISGLASWPAISCASARCKVRQRSGCSDARNRLPTQMRTPSSPNGSAVRRDADAQAGGISACRPRRASHDDEPIAIVGLSGRYPQARDLRGVLGKPARRAATASAKCRRALGLARVLQRRSQRSAGQRLQQVGRLHRRLRRVRSAVLQHLAARSAMHRSAGAAVPAVCAGWRWRTPATRASLHDRAGDDRGPGRRLRRRDVRRIPAVRCGGGAGGKIRRSRNFGQHRQPRVVLPEPARPEHADRHDVLVVADGDPCGLRAPEAGRTELAIAGGVNLCIHPNKYLLLSAGQFISSDGRCQSFGDGGDGYVPGEGVGAVLLKRLSRCRARRRPHLRRDPRQRASTTAARPTATRCRIRRRRRARSARRLAKPASTARTISYIEAHGTGTELGDPIEIAGLTPGVRRRTRRGHGLLRDRLGEVEHRALRSPPPASRG